MSLGDGSLKGRSSYLFSGSTSSSQGPQFSCESYFSSSVKEKALIGDISALIEKGAVELAPQSPRYCSHMSVVLKAFGAC